MEGFKLCSLMPLLCSCNVGDHYNYRNTNHISNKFFFITFLSLTVFVCSYQDIDQQVPTIFKQFPTVYYGSILLLSVGFFTSFVGLVTSSSDSRERFSRFCAVYSSYCLLFLAIASSSVVILPELDLPWWIEKKVFSVVVTLTNPFPLFVSLTLPMPILQSVTPINSYIIP